MKKHLLPLTALVCMLSLAALPSRSFFTYGGMERLEIATDSSRPLLPSIPYPYSDTTTPFILNLSFGFGYEPTGTAMITDEGATLGRVLFYDTRLSHNQTISCASCHIPEFGFSDSARFSRGFNDEVTHRNSMGLANVRLQPTQRFFWDASEDTMQVQVFAALQSEIEMGMDLDTLVQRVENTDFYPALFQAAFATTEVTPDRIAGAISQFVLSMKSANSRYDIGLIQTWGSPLNPFPNFTASENRGKELFFSVPLGCSHCHVGNNFTMFFPSNNGLDSVYEDKGFGELSGFPHEMALFKATSLRNIAQTAPYMHDGRFQTLEEVIEHYNSGLQDHPNLGPLLKEYDAKAGREVPKQFNLTQQEKDDLVAFLGTLTDNYFMTDPRWQNPFIIDEVAVLPIHPTDTMTLGTSHAAPKTASSPVRVLGHPVKDQLRIEWASETSGVTQIRIITLDGKTVRTHATTENEARIEMIGLPSGNYILQVQQGTFATAQQIVKQ